MGKELLVNQTVAWVLRELHLGGPPWEQRLPLVSVTGSPFFVPQLTLALPQEEPWL